MDIKVVQNQNEVYQKEKLLGEGAFGKAYLVKHKLTGEQLVIKQMNIQHMSSKQKQQTIKQAQILRNLSHPNIVNFREVYITKNNKLKIVMQYAECGDLAKAIAARKAKKQYFEEGQILDWFTQICLAIKHVHDRKILHRDIKGQNIFIAKNNSLKLGDFGIARILNMTHDKARTVVGTPYYLSPEIIENKPYSFKSDIWSIGAVLYEMCCLQPPFVANSLQMLALKIVKGSYTPIQGNYSKQLKSLVTQLLTLDPNKRPAVNEILQKPVIQNRIRNFLSETKRIAEFSHTVLHNQKVEIFANKLVQIQKEKQTRNAGNSNEKNLQQERRKLKEEQAKMQAVLLKKKEQQKKKQQKKRQDQIRQRQLQIKRKEQQKKRRAIYEQQKKQQMQRQYEDNIRKAQLMKARKAEEQRQYQRQMEMANLMRQKDEYEERKRREAQNAKKYNKKLEDEKKMQDFNDFARKQYYQNLEIRKRAEQRARRQQQSYYVEPVRENQMLEKNFHYVQQNRPKTKQQSRGSSNDRKQNNSDFYNNNAPSNKKKDPQPTEEQLINAFCNPNYKKGSQGPSVAVVKKDVQAPVSQKRNSSNVVEGRRQSSKKIDDQREKIRKDRENFAKNSQKTPDNEASKAKQPEPVIQVSKWGKKKSMQKRPEKQQSPTRYESPRFRAPQQNAKELTEATTEQPEKGFNTLIDDSENLFLEARNPAQFDKYIGQLQEILQGVQKKIELLPEIPLAEEIMFRDDDQFQLSLTVQAKKALQPQLDTEQVDLDYFSNYSKLQTLRIQLEEALGLDNFIRLYRYIEKQVSEKGLEGFNIIEAIKEVGGDIDSKVVNKNVTLLLTLVALEDKMSYT